MGDFAQINKNEPDYPRRPNEKPEENSANFTPPYKVQTGNTRGDLRVKGVITIVDEQNVIRLIMGFKKSAF